MSTAALTHLRAHRFAGLAGGRTGPRLIVTGAVHGNETAGTRGIDRVLGEIERGEVDVPGRRDAHRGAGQRRRDLAGEVDRQVRGGDDVHAPIIPARVILAIARARVSVIPCSRRGSSPSRR